MNPFIEKYKHLDRLAYFNYMVALKKIYHRLKKANLNVNEVESIHLENTFKEYEIIKPIDNRDNKEGTPYLFLFESKEDTIKNYLKFIVDDPSRWKKLYDYGLSISRNDLILFMNFTDEDIKVLEDEIFAFNRVNIDHFSKSNNLIKDFNSKLEKIKKLSNNSNTQIVEFINKELKYKHYEFVSWDYYDENTVLEFDYKNEIADFKRHSSIEMKLKYEGFLEKNLKEYTMANSDSKEKVKFDNFRIFIKNLEYNYPYETSVMSFKYQIRDDLKFFFQEILDNLLTLTYEEKAIYFDRLLFEIKNLEQHVFAKYEDIKNWLDKYKISEDDLISHQHPDNVLYKILTADPPTFKETFEEGYNVDTDPVQKDFYNYYYGLAIQEAIDFINEHKYKLNVGNQSEPQFNKIKVELTVPQLSYLFRSLFEEKLLDVKNKTELFKTLAAVFQTKGKDDLSPNSIKNKFDSPEEAAAIFWHERFIHLTQIAHTDKGKLVN